ncbi:MAG TPA: hypothetical protein VMB70_05945 [Terriglobia bacterium]|nr:hypothetical protein [Terriglobia bacterium]
MKRISIFLPLLLLLAGCDQNVTRVSSGERFEDAPPLSVDPEARPLAGAEPDLNAIPGMEGKVPPFVKVFFMHQFVEALYSVPKNKHPNPKWESPLKDPENGRVWCTDCHGDKFDFAKMPKQRLPLVDTLEKDHEFMVELMTKWVGRLNSDEFRAKAKLKGPVQCLTCHETDPRKE